MTNSFISATERRAIAARLSACLVPIALLLSLAVPNATAAPVAPRLVTTNPGSTEPSPATSLTPAVLGEAEPEDGIIIERFPIPRLQMSGVTRTVEHPTLHPEYEIQIFDGGNCEGAVVASGTAEALEGSGITVSVTANAETTLSAKQVNPASPSEPSACSNQLPYWEGVLSSGGGSGSGGGGSSSGTGSEGGGSGSGSSSGSGISNGTPVGKPEAPRIHTNPGGRSNNVHPLVVGSAPGADSVAVYANPNCSGTPLATGTPAQLSSGFEVSVAKNAETTFSAVAMGAQHSSCSSPATYTEDSTPPRTRITMGPGIKTRKRQAIFRFKDITEDPPGTTFVCKIDKAKWKSCSSPLHLKHLKLGHHNVAIRATDLAGNVELKPVKRSFIVVGAATS